MPFDATIHDRAGELRQRELALDRTAFEGDARHAVDERARLVLAKRACTRLAHLEQPLRTVLALPVRVTPMALAPAARAPERNRTSTEGRWPETGGPSLSRPTKPTPSRT